MERTSSGIEICKEKLNLDKLFEGLELGNVGKEVKIDNFSGIFPIVTELCNLADKLGRN